MRKFVLAVALLVGALCFVLPPIMVFYLAGPVWPAFEFAIIQAFVVLILAFVARVRIPRF